MDIQLLKHNEKVPDTIMEHIRRVPAKNLSELNAELAPLGFAAIEVFQSKVDWKNDTTPYPTPSHYMEIFEIHDYVDRMVGIALEKPDDSRDLVTKLRGLREALKGWGANEEVIRYALPSACRERVASDAGFINNITVQSILDKIEELRKLAVQLRGLDGVTAADEMAMKFAGKWIKLHENCYGKVKDVVSCNNDTFAQVTGEKYGVELEIVVERNKEDSYLSLDDKNDMAYPVRLEDAVVVAPHDVRQMVWEWESRFDQHRNEFRDKFDAACVGGSHA